MVEAVRWKVIKVKGQTRVQLYDAKGVAISSKNTFWSGDFNCSGRKLTTLEGVPETVLGDFICSKNKLRNLKHSPRIVKGDFVCNDNKLANFNGISSEIGGEIYSSYLTCQSALK